MTELDSPRRLELAGRLAQVRARVAAACASAGRDPGEVTLVAVAKTYPALDVLHLAALGLLDIGENRDQEAAAKAAAVAAAGVAVRWHFVGRLQRNKCRSVVGYASVVESVDRRHLAVALADAANRVGRRLDVLVQISIDGDPARGGALAAAEQSSPYAQGPYGLDAQGPYVPDADAHRPYVPDADVHGPAAERSAGYGRDLDADLGSVLDAVAGAPSLRLGGLMAVAPLDWPPERAYARLAQIAAVVRSQHGATVLSAGMSGDLEAAIEHGATQVRVGSALLGSRAPLR